jgi:hypothetical protein
METGFFDKFWEFLRPYLYKLRWIIAVALYADGLTWGENSHFKQFCKLE